MGMGDNNVPLTIGVDLYNQCTTGEVAKTLNAIKADADHVPCVLLVKDDENDNDDRKEIL